MEGVGQGALAAAAKHSNFDLDEVAKWKAGAPVPFSFLANTFEGIAETSKRLEITQLLTICFRAILGRTPAALLPTVYLCTNRVAPAHEGVELGVGDSILVKVPPRPFAPGMRLVGRRYTNTHCQHLGSVTKRCSTDAASPLGYAPWSSWSVHSQCSTHVLTEVRPGAVQALAAATGRSEAKVKKDYEESGDLGTVAAAARATQRTMFPTPPLTIPGVSALHRLHHVPVPAAHLVLCTMS